MNVNKFNEKFSTHSTRKELSAKRIVETIERLSLRIERRFPQSSLKTICRELLLVGQRSSQQAIWIARPIISIRVFVSLLLLATVVGIYWLAFRIPMSLTTEQIGLVDIVQGLEAATNEILLVAAGVFFLISFEKRIKRNKAMAAINELRSYAHIIDMHQLTKDPDQFAESPRILDDSQDEVLSPEELERYLDYCSEMLSLVGKIAALYLQSFADEVLLAAVSEIENLTTNLSVKIWQKIIMIKDINASNSARPRLTSKAS